MTSYLLPENIDLRPMLHRIQSQYSVSLQKLEIEDLPFRYRGRCAREWSFLLAGEEASQALGMLEDWLDAQGIF